MKIAIVGLGYVGLPLAIQFSRSECEVLGLDVDKAKVESINRSESYIKHITSYPLLPSFSLSLPSSILHLPCSQNK